MNAQRRAPWLLLACVPWLAGVALGQEVPGPMRGEMPALISATKPENALFISVSAASIFDDNLRAQGFRHASGAEQYFSAKLSWQETRRRARWSISYQPGVRVGTAAPVGNQLNQFFGASLEVNPSTRWLLRVRQDYTLTTDPFDREGEAPLQPALGPLERPNDMTVLPQLRRSASFSHAGVSYRLSRHTTLGIGGSYGWQNYSDYANTGLAPLTNNRARSASGYISRQISRRYTAGLEYRALELSFPGHEMRGLTHSALAFQQWALTSNSSIVVYAGPEYSRTRSQTWRNTPVTSAAWSPAAGAIYSWYGARNSLQGGYSRRVNDGGGLQGPVRVSSGWIRLGARLRHSWSTDLSAELAQQSALPVSLGERLRQLRTGAGLRRELGRSTVVRVSYDRLYQSGKSQVYRPGNHNRVMLSVEQSFMQILGR